MYSYAQVRDIKKWGKPEFVYDNVDKFESSPELKNGVHTIIHNGVPIDILLDLRHGAPLTFIFKGNTRRKADTRLPVFVGFSIVSPVGNSRVSISDPGMYLDPTIGLAWYAGGKNLDIQSVLPRIIQKIVSTTAPSKVMMIGGSGGGYAAMYYSRYVAESLAVAWNPQNDFLDYEERGVMAYVSKAFDVSNIDEAKAVVPRYVNNELSSFYRKTSASNYVIYLQNIIDTHVEKHCKPFMASFGYEISTDVKYKLVNTNTYLYFSDNWGGDHEPPPKEFLSSITRDLLAYDGSWGQLLNTHDIVDILNKADNTRQNNDLREIGA